ncbi:MAG: class I SAM-dependent methyltransferase [Thermoleophilaceae bacterium]|nr:class I SAM-dependent methyltransferase [Thermoleophilaceae bacterium]
MRNPGQPAPAEAAPGPALPEHLDPADRRILERAIPHTMTGHQRLLATVDSARYCLQRGIPGDFVECGVWRGGSVLAMILVLQEAEVEDRDLYLFDTFEGMTEPTEADTSPMDAPALENWREAERKGETAWPELFGSEESGEEAVRATLLATGYPAERIHLVRGPVEETIPGTMPERIALLRLDTDWYESTRHELQHLYPALSERGVLIIDDYGHWEGARKAVDEYFAERPAVLLNRIDYTGRLALKC